MRSSSSTILFLSLWSTASLLQAADPVGDVQRGETAFRQACAVCHAAGPGMTGGQGPALIGIVGQKAGQVPGASYTKAMLDSGLVWDHATLDRFLANPTTVVPGTNMVVPVPQAAVRRDLIAYLASIKAPPSTARKDPVPTADPKATDPNDWRHHQPGASRSISADQLPAPFSTPSPRNGPSVVKQPEGARLSVPAGFKVELFAKGLNGPRLVQVAPNGDLFVAETRSNRIRVLRASPDGAAPAQDHVFAEGLDRPFGMAFYPGGANPQWVYVANNNSVVRFAYRSGDLKAGGAPVVVVPKLSDTTQGHTTRDIAFSKDGRRLFITVGSGSNVAEGEPKKSPEEIRQWEADHLVGSAWGSETLRANLLVTDPEGRAPLKVFASGIRNPVGLAVHPLTGDVWTSTNERDGLGDDLVPDYVTRVREGGFYGWPWYYMGNHEDPRHQGARKDLAGRVIVPDVLLQAHSAALGIAFYSATEGASVFPEKYRGNLFVALHGSWNRVSRTGYKVVRAIVRDGKPTGQYEDFLTGFVVDAKGVWGRPVGVAVAKDGALLVSEDGNGTIWRISTDGSAR